MNLAAPSAVPSVVDYVLGSLALLVILGMCLLSLWRSIDEVREYVRNEKGRER